MSYLNVGKYENNYYQSIERTGGNVFRNDHVVISSGFPTVNCRK